MKIWPEQSPLIKDCNQKFQEMNVGNSFDVELMKNTIDCCWSIVAFMTKSVADVLLTQIIFVGFFSAPLPSSDGSSSYNNLRQDMSLVTQNASVPMPMPENTALGTSSQDYFAEVDGPAGRQPNSSALRGILKHLYTSTSADSLLSPLDLQNPVSLDSPTEIWIDRKQVRFSSIVIQSGVEWQNGKELGEHSLLDMDSITLSETENNRVNNSDLEKTGCTTSGTHRPVLNQCGVDSQEAEVSFRNEANQQEAGQQLVLGGKIFI